MPHPLLFNRVSLDARGVWLGTGLKSRSSYLFYPLTPKNRLTLPLGRFPHMNVHKKLRSCDTVQPPLGTSLGWAHLGIGTQKPQTLPLVSCKLTFPVQLLLFAIVIAFCLPVDHLSDCDGHLSAGRQGPKTLYSHWFHAS